MIRIYHPTKTWFFAFTLGIFNLIFIQKTVLAWEKQSDKIETEIEYVQNKQSYIWEANINNNNNKTFF